MIGFRKMHGNSFPAKFTKSFLKREVFLLFHICCMNKMFPFFRECQVKHWGKHKVCCNLLAEMKAR